jgi:hypothetical protein
MKKLGKKVDTLLYRSGSEYVIWWKWWLFL